VAQIRRLRTLHPNLGKEKLSVLLAPWCKERRMRLPSVSTLGRIIARAPDKMRHAPQRIDRLGRSQPLRRYRKPRKPKAVTTVPWQCLAVDTIERGRDGLRRDLLTFIDPASRFAFALAIPSKASRHTQSALAAALSLLPTKPQVVLSDNAAEFESGFAKTLQAHGIKRWYTYPNTPK
jgi:hypothetical protein